MSIWLFTEEHRNLYDAQDVYAFMKPLLVREKKLTKRADFIWVLALNEDLVLLSLELMKFRSFDTYKGKIKTADFFSIPLTVKASALMLVQSKDTAQTTPTGSDIMYTEKLVTAGKTVDLAMLDHVLISPKGYHSMCESSPGLFGFDEF